MRRKFWLLSTMVAGACALDASDAFAQRGGGGGGFPGGGGGGGRSGFGGGQMPDPDALWKQMSGGADTIDLNRMPQAKWMLGGAPAPPDGMITKQMYQNFMATRMAGGGGRGMGGPGGPTPPVAAPVPGSGAPVVIAVGSGSSGDKPVVSGGPGGAPPGGFPGGGYSGGGGGFPGGGGGMGGGRGGNMWGDPEALFQRADQNRDGKITRDETKMLLPYFDQIDTNKDGAIDLAELKAFAATQVAASPGGGPGGGWIGNPGGGGEQPRNQEVEEERPVVYRFGKLPKDFPYAALDKDEDGQVSLFEWRTAGKSIEDFLDRDLNGDGFLTAEEWLRGTKTSLGGGDTGKDKGKSFVGGGYPGGNMGGGRPGMGGGRFGAGGDATKDKEKEKDDKKDDKKDGKRGKN